MKNIVISGVVLMAMGVVIGAFGAHVLKPILVAEPGLLAAYQTGVEYHIYHALGLMLIGLLGYQFPGLSLKYASWLLLSGVILFSGSLYTMAITGARWLGMITPIGGAAFIIGWVWIAWALFCGLRK